MPREEGVRGIGGFDGDGSKIIDDSPVRSLDTDRPGNIDSK